MQTVSENNFKDRMHELETRIATLKERAKISKKSANDASEKQVRALEDQYNLLRAELEKKEATAKKAYSDLSEGAKKAWDELWTGVDRAFKNVH